MDLEPLIAFRQNLHQFPDLSGHEEATSSRVAQFIAQYHPDKTVTNIGGAGICFIFNGNQDGPCVAIRSELDALPIFEKNDFHYASIKKGLSHKCGHDGHMAIVAGLSQIFCQKRPKKGKVMLLFQPAEETGNGADLMMNDASFSSIKPDMIFALHNLPGYPKHQIVTKQNVFSAASKGLIIELKGKTSHAAEPENGLSPAMTMSLILKELLALNNSKNGLTDFGIVTVVHAQLGTPSFGITPGNAVIMTTLRAYQPHDLQTLENKIKNITKHYANECGIACDFSEKEVFQATINDTICFKHIKNAAEFHQLDFVEAASPFKWSEDFGVFTQNIPGAMFGLGAGTESPDLHNPDYDFPDDILETGISMFEQIINQILN